MVNTLHPEVSGVHRLTTASNLYLENEYHKKGRVSPSFFVNGQISSA